MVTARASRAPAIRYRPARRTDVETLAELGARSYRVASVEKRREFYTDHPRFTLRDVRAAELDGEIVASLVLYPLTAFVRGQRLPVTGIGSVAVSPEHRRRGIGEACMRAALRELRQRGSHLSALYAFRGSYYRKLGYGVSEFVHQLAISASNLPSSDEARRVRRLMLPDRLAVQALYQRVASQGHFALDRTDAWWSRRLWTNPNDWVVYEKRRGQIEGYLAYEVENARGPFRLALTLTECVAVTPEAHRGLVGYLAALSDQVEEIHYAAPADHAWLTLLRTAQNMRPGAEIGLFSDTGGVAAGAMLRLVDVKGALELLPVRPASRGELAIEVMDAVFPQNARAFRVAAREGRLRVTPEARKGRGPRLAAAVDVLAQIAAGTLSPLRATEVGLAQASGGAAEIAESWFRSRPMFLYQFNAF